jgi:hypothetical protein
MPGGTSGRCERPPRARLVQRVVSRWRSGHDTDRPQRRRNRYGATVPYDSPACGRGEWSRRPRSVTRPCWSCSPRCGTGRPTCRGAQAEALAAALAGTLRGGRAPDARNLSASQGNDRRRVVARWPQPRLGPSSWVAVAAYEPVILTNQGLALAAVGLIAATSFQLPRGGPRLRRRGCR